MVSAAEKMDLFLSSITCKSRRFGDFKRHGCVHEVEHPSSYGGANYFVGSMGRMC